MVLVITRSSQAAARYTPVGGVERCSQCRFYNPQGTCGRIIGPVSPRGWCKYYSREMAQRYQAGSVYGVSPPPALDVSFMTPGSLDPSITFTRASTATYFDVAGLIQTAASGAPRWGYDPVTHALRGLLIEDQRQNLFLQSADLTNASWVKTNATLAAGTAGPNGATTGSGLVSNNGAIGIINQVVALVAGTTYTVSAYMRAGSATTAVMLIAGGAWVDAVTRTVQFNLLSGTTSALAGAGASATITAVGNGWYRCTLTATPDQSASPQTQVSRAVAAGDGVTVQHYVFGPQLEAGGSATSFISTTTAAVTRAADAAVIAPTPWFVAQSSTLATEYMVPYTAVLPASVATASAELDDGTTNNALILRHVSPSLVEARVFAASAGVGGASAGSFTPNVVTKHAAAFGGLVGSTAGNGIAAVPFTFTGNPAGINRLAIGSGRSNAINGWMRRVRYWPRVMSDAELQGVTT